VNGITNKTDWGKLDLRTESETQCKEQNGMTKEEEETLAKTCLFQLVAEGATFLFFNAIFKIDFVNNNSMILSNTNNN